MVKFPILAWQSLRGRLRNSAVRFLDWNPFYLISAGLLLFGVGRLLHALFGDLETAAGVTFHNLRVEPLEFLANYGVLELYGVLLILTAIFLARRNALYDATLLVILAAVFVPIPLILISYGLHENLSPQTLALACGLTLLLAVVKTSVLRRYFPQFRFPWQLCLLGAVLLGGNALFPFLFHSLSRTSINGSLSGDGATQLALDMGVLVVLPLLVLASLLLPSAKRDSDSPPRRRWLPLMVFLIWVSMTGFHLFWVGFIYETQWHLSYGLPLLWGVSWVLYWRRTEIDRFSGAGWAKVLFNAPAIIGLITFAVAAFEPDGLLLPVCRVMLVVNALTGIRQWRVSRATGASWFRWLTAYALLSSVPVDWVSPVLPAIQRHHVLAGALLSMLLLAGIRRRTPFWSVVTAFSLFAVLRYLLRDISHGPDIAWQLGYWTLLLHSCRWQAPVRRSARILRSLTAVILLTHAWLWVFDGSVQATRTTCLTAFSVLVFALLQRCVFARSWPRLLAITAGAALSLMPAYVMVEAVQLGLTGLVIIVFAFGMFALGTWIALNRDRWHSQDDLLSASAP